MGENKVSPVNTPAFFSIALFWEPEPLFAKFYAKVALALDIYFY